MRGSGGRGAGIGGKRGKRGDAGDGGSVRGGVFEAGGAGPAGE